jgi:5-methylcytosine-specific restriction endonuclease McrA
MLSHSQLQTQTKPQTKLQTKPHPKSKTQECRDNWIALGNTIPKCINNGCNRDVAIRHSAASPQGLIPSFKTECSTCSSFRCKGKTLKGITFHKKTYCENKDSILGFKCPMDESRYDEFPSDIYDMDHKDGDHHNNTPENLITICKICHARKGKENGDFNSQKSSSRKQKKESADVQEITSGEISMDSLSLSD